MPFSVVAFSESQDEAGAMTKMAAVQDQHIKTAGDTITVGPLSNIVGSYAAVGTLGLEARLISPTLRRTNPLYITPVELAIAPSVDPLMMYHPANPIALTPNESLEAENNANPAAAEQHLVAVWLSDGALSPITGEIFTVNCTITTALVVNSWEFSEITFPDSLPVADYDIVGARCVAANGIVFRFSLVGESHRPGGISASTVGGKDPWMQRYGRMGVWGTFNTVQPPGVEIIGSAATGSATYDLFLDVIKR